VSFLPLANNFSVANYGSGSDVTVIKGVTVSVAPSSVATEDGEANVFATDSASVELEKQSFAGVAGSPQCLILRANVGALHGIVNGITYHVTVLSVFNEGLPNLILGGNDEPSS
jgi:hypothetical protein